ncbi:hypothetical protein [Actinomadura oligospora]|uniref:hypothetical protein n=1 Tax=Actinomadura oligospora TaxID=111804 RepID=UPI00047ED3BA|nr:hypothetical protein [Actinomadura oligospora]
MRKILLSGVTAVLALSLTACNFNVNGKTSASGPSTAAPAPSDSTAPGHASAPSGKASSPGGDSDGSDPSPSARPCDPNVSPIREGACPVKSKWGRLRYLASGKYTVGDTAFFTTQDTVLVVASGTCPDGTGSGPNMRCSLNGIEDWMQASPHNVTVSFSGGNATKIQETQ